MVLDKTQRRHAKYTVLIITTSHCCLMDHLHHYCIWSLNRNLFQHHHGTPKSRPSALVIFRA